LSQPLPLSPQCRRSTVARPSRASAADAGERSQRHAFGRLLDCFAQSDRGGGAAKDSRGTQTNARASAAAQATTRRARQDAATGYGDR
jgi:hypothetical protein